MKKNLLSKIILSLLFSITSFSFLSGCNSNSGEANYDWSDIPDEEDESGVTHIVTFHYGFNDEDFNATTKVIAKEKYTGIYKAVSKNGRKITINSMVLASFSPDVKYKISGYSDDRWMKNGINSDFDVYVNYDYRNKYDVTFRCGTFTKTVQEWEDLEIPQEDIPTVEEMGFSDNAYLCGWTNEGEFTKVTKSFVAEAKVANMGSYSMKLEAEDAQYIDVHKSDSSPIFSDVGSMGKSVYISNSGCSSTSTITISFKTVKEIELGLMLAVYIREKNLKVNLFDLYQITVSIGNEEHVLESGVFDNNIKVINAKNKNTNMGWGDFEEMAIAQIKFPSGVSRITIAAHGALLSGSNVDYVKFIANEDLKYTLALEGNAIPLNKDDVVKGNNKIRLQAENAQNIRPANMTSVICSDFASTDGEGYSVYLSNKNNEQKGYFDYTFSSNKAGKAMMSIMLMTRMDVNAPILNGYDIFWLDENLNYTYKMSPAQEGMVNEDVVLTPVFGEFHMFMVGYYDVKQGLNTFRIMSDGLVLASNVDFIELAFDDETVEITTPTVGQIPTLGTYNTQFNAEDFNVIKTHANNSETPIFSDFGQGDNSLYFTNAGNDKEGYVELFINSSSDTKAIISLAMILRSVKTYTTLEAFDLYFAQGNNEYAQVKKDGANTNAIALNETIVDSGNTYTKGHIGMMAELELKSGLNRIKLVSDGVRLGDGFNFDYIILTTKDNVSITKAESK